MIIAVNGAKAPLILRLCVVVSKGKAVPLQAWIGPEGSRMLRFPNFMTTAQDGGKVVSLMHRPPLPPGEKSASFTPLHQSLCP